jgi:hypothetical protein
MGFDIVFSWQALVLAVLASVAMLAVKRVLDYAWKRRKENRFMTRIGMPAIHGLVGFLAGVLVPFRPESVVAYVAEHGGGWLSFGLWGLLVGGICGDVLYTKVKGFLKHGGP